LKIAWEDYKTLGKVQQQFLTLTLESTNMEKEPLLGVKIIGKLGRFQIYRDLIGRYQPIGLREVVHGTNTSTNTALWLDLTNRKLYHADKPSSFCWRFTSDSKHATNKTLMFKGSYANGLDWEIFISTDITPLAKEKGIMAMVTLWEGKPFTVLDYRDRFAIYYDIP